MSLIFMSGLLGVSIHSTFVASGRIAARTASRSLMFTVESEAPHGMNMRLTRRCVPP